MKSSEIKIKVALDKDNVPDHIYWDADEKEAKGWSESKSISLAIWDHKVKNTLRIDLWTKDMPIDEMKKYLVDSLGGLAQSVLNSTGDEYMAGRMNDLCEEFVQYIKKQSS